MGGFLAAFYNVFDWAIFTLSLLTTLFLQILSNLANDFGDSVSGVDSAEREGPSRTVQSGKISLSAMKKSLIVFSVLSFISGCSLIYVAFGGASINTIVFLILGLGAIAAAIKYTVGQSPYGYAGFGDVFVLLFFGLAGVVGSYYLYAGNLIPEVFLPALSCGFFAVGVLNVNNIRDIESDQKAGKRSIPVRLGKTKAIIYHVLLIVFGWVAGLVFSVTAFQSWTNLIYLLILPVFLLHLKMLINAENSKSIDPLLKQLAISTLIFVLLFGAGLLV